MSTRLYLIQTEDMVGNLLPGVVMHADSPNGHWDAQTGACAWQWVSLAAGEYHVDFELDGQVIGHRDWILGDPPADPIRVGLEVAIGNWPAAKLRKIQGAIWPTRGPVQFGMRPGAEDNIIDTGCEAYSSVDRVTSKQRLHARRYTHVQMGPFVDPGYHGKYPPVDFRSDNGADTIAQIEDWWRAGFSPVCFLGPDGWSTAQMQELEDIFRQPRWQRACRQIVPYGWEPSKDTSNAQFVERFAWGRRVFPNALQYIHLAADFDAPGNNDDFTPGRPHYIGFAEAWARVCPYLTGYLIQNGPYTVAPSDNATLATNFANQFRANVRGSLRDRFTNGYAGWPRTCATGEPLDLIAGEETSFPAFWDNLPEDVSIAWGSLARSAGADGFFDGGVPV